MRFNKSVIMIMVFTFLVLSGLAAQESQGLHGRAALNAGVGFSFARGDYAVEYNSDIEFSFSAGIRVTLDDLFAENIFLIADIGYLQFGWRGYVEPADYYFFRSHEFLNISAMAGTSIDMFYFAGGLYFGLYLDANQYNAGTDQWIYLRTNSDLGILAEGGAHLFSFLSLGVQARFGLLNIHNSTEVFTTAIHAIFTFHLLNF